LVESDVLTAGFQEQRPRLRAVAYRMLGSLSEADDAVQDAWIRASAADSGDIDNLGAWLTTIVTRVCLNMLRARKQRREDPLDVHLPDPIVSAEIVSAGNASAEKIGDPEHEAIVTDAVGLALMVVLDTLTPVERVAFVLHDTFAIPFEEIAPIIDRTPAATRQIASRARRRVRANAPAVEPNISRQREVVNAFFAAARNGDFEGLVAVLHPDIIFRLDGGTRHASLTTAVSGAHQVASQAVMFGPNSPVMHPVLVNGTVGVVAVVGGRVQSVTSFTVADGAIVAIDALFDPDRLREIDFGPLAS
jgi:RNA polymerase sigma-70 factor, ECF subfamily